MTTVTEATASSSRRPVIICDVSPPRGAVPGALTDALEIDADFLSVSYAPGQSARVNSIFVAAYLQEHHGRHTVFTLATRDMNPIAVQSLLLGAEWEGLRNVVIVRGDPIRERERNQITTVNDYSTTSLLQDIGSLNRGRDFRGLKLTGSTSFCAGATVDLSRGIKQETSLAVRKAGAGASFFLCQAHFHAGDLSDLRRNVLPTQGRHIPIFAGVQILDADGIDFGNVPNYIRGDLDSGRSGLEIARELVFGLWSEGITTFYVIPTILRGGLRDYRAASDLIEYIRSLPSSGVVASR